MKICVKNMDLKRQRFYYLVGGSKISFSLVAGLVSPPPRTFNISLVDNTSKLVKFALFSDL